MEGTIKVIIKRPDEKYGHVTHIANNLKNLQSIVDGRIETVSFGPCLVICNEEGKLMKLQHNFLIGHDFKDLICGTAIICGRGEEDFTDVPIDMSTWRRLLAMWGNAS